MMLVLRDGTFFSNFFIMKVKHNYRFAAVHVVLLVYYKSVFLLLLKWIKMSLLV